MGTASRSPWSMTRTPRCVLGSTTPSVTVRKTPSVGVSPTLNLKEPDVAESMFTEFDHRTPPLGPDGTPFQYYEALRDVAVAGNPIGWSEHHNGYWVVAGYPECHEIMQNHDTFSSAAVTFPAYQTGEKNTLMLAGMDEPLHKKYRSLVIQPFSPRQANDTEEELARTTNELIDGFIADGAT